MVLGRHYKQRWHLFRNMVTQLVEHQRIYTTQAKAKMLRAYAQRLIKHAKLSAQNINRGTNQLNKILTTDLTRKKATLELATRFKDQRCNYTNVSRVKYRRRGDNAPIVIIEYRGNEYEKYEKQKKEELLKNPKHVDMKRWKTKILNEHRDFLITKQAENKNSELPAAFFEKHIKNVEFEIACEQKPKNAPPIYKMLL